jgi:hypothetical protein
MVLMPSTLHVDVGAPAGELVPFEVRTEEGTVAVRSGGVLLRA